MRNLHEPLVSVLMTVYNRERYIADAIKSVLASTYKNWELIIVDDRSNDTSLQIAKTFASQEERIKVYLNDMNLGDYPNRNKAASYAKGKYLKYVDADDMIYPYGLEQLVYYMEQYPSAGFGLCSIEQDEKCIFPFVLNSKESYERHYIDKKSIFHKAPLSSIIRRDVFEEKKGFANVRHYGDYELWHRLALDCSLVLMPHGIVWYRLSDGQEASIRKKNPMNALKTLMVGQDFINRQTCPLDNTCKKQVNLVYEKRISKLILSQIKYSNFSKFKEMRKYYGIGYLGLVNNVLLK
ncbi:glycosyltransferase family 2 protein [Formosa haliotis]|uniref:glycosyltransferase family 2 protein n=1 Tax=Formosa haliotis TaxID=1555194 RepID=UPI0008250CA2|nr:glycosyltransferase family 2 protein [Formosa haliotis]